MINESLATEEHMQTVFVGLKDVIIDESQLEPIYKLKAYPFSAEHCAAISASKKGGTWYFHVETLQERYTKDILSSPWIRGRSPKTKHGGRIGEYTEERADKARKNRTYRKGIDSPLYGKKRTAETIAKMKLAAKTRHVIYVSCLCCNRVMNYGLFCNHIK